MLLPHATALAEARTRVVTLADQARTPDASSAFERILIELDRVHGDECPAVSDIEHVEDRANQIARLTSGLEHLEQYGVDPLSLELLIALLEDAYALDGA